MSEREEIEKLIKTIFDDSKETIVQKLTNMILDQWVETKKTKLLLKEAVYELWEERHSNQSEESFDKEFAHLIEGYKL